MGGFEGFTQAEISNDGRWVKLTRSFQYHAPETYYVRWAGDGQLQCVDALTFESIRKSFPAALAAQGAPLT